MILLIKPPYNPAVFRGGESLGLGILGAVLKRQGIAARVLDPTLQAMSFPLLMQEIKASRPQMVGLSITCSSFLSSGLKIAEAVKRWDPSVHITLGGPYPSFAFETLLAEVPSIDTIVRFEGEQTLPRLWHAIEAREHWHDIPGLCFREGKEIVATPPAPPLDDLDALPWPLREPYSFGPGVRDVTLLSSRGCPWDCTYCLQSRFYQHSGWRGRSAADMVREMLALRHEWHAGAFLFNDDNFLGSTRAGKDRAREFAQILRAEKMTVPWAISCLPHDVDLSLFETLKTAGLAQVFLGIESAVPSVLERWNKKAPVAQSRKALQTFRELGLGIEVGFISFDPDTTLAELKENLEFLKSSESATTAALLNRMEVHEGMSITERLKREGRLLKEGPRYDYRNADERVERVYALFHQILPILADAEQGWLQLRFSKQTGTGSRRTAPKPLRRFEKRLSDRICRTAEDILRFSQSPGSLKAPSTHSFIAESRNTLQRFNREFLASLPL